MIEIGGGFRIPEIIETAGTTLVEVGTTNRTRASDYEAALRRREPARAILKVHRSNFRLEGFTAEVPLADLVRLGRKARRPVIYDLGGGLMLDPGPEALRGEPTLPGAARSGATAVVASGDKLLGGPQAGILVGTRAFVARCRRNPLARAVRADKLTLAGLAATLRARWVNDPWRGAAAANLLAFRRLHPGAREVVLVDNYRSTQPILDTSARLISYNNPYRLEAIAGIDKRLRSPREAGVPVRHFHRFSFVRKPSFQITDGGSPFIQTVCLQPEISQFRIAPHFAKRL